MDAGQRVSPASDDRFDRFMETVINGQVIDIGCDLTVSVIEWMDLPEHLQQAFNEGFDDAEAYWDAKAVREQSRRRGAHR